MLDEFMETFRRTIPLTALNTAWRKMDKEAKSVLDIGCGKGKPMEFINEDKRFYTVGVDVFKAYLTEAKARRIHDDYILCDIRKLPLRDKSFDIVLSNEVLEHLNKSDGLSLMTNAELIARRQIILTTPVGVYEQEAYDDNPFQTHQYIWKPSEIKHLGYNVIGTGIMRIGGDSGLSSKVPKVLLIPLNSIYTLSGFVTVFLPSISGDIVCIKNID